MAEKKEKVEVKPMVRVELPTAPQRELEDAEGNIYEAVTLEEALTEILEKVRAIHKAVA